ncbi:Prophage LambdaBa04, DNA-binding protein [Bacillus cereus BDRD-ST26]|nr:Prophage LambdaBa04, DNA-binding protein [Bacillus cereus BDRD-ST26]
MALLVGLVKLCKILPLFIGKHFFYNELKSERILVIFNHSNEQQHLITKTLFLSIV